MDKTAKILKDGATFQAFIKKINKNSHLQPIPPRNHPKINKTHSK